MGRSRPPIHSSAPPRVKSKEHITENSSLKMNTFIKNAKQNKSDAAKINTMQMDPPGGRRRMGRAAKVHTPESESSLSPSDMDSCNDGGNVSGSAGVVNAGSSECRRSSRKKTIKFDVRDLLNKNRKSHKIQIEARIDSNAPKTGAESASKEEMDSKQKTFIEKSAIFRRYSLSENKPPPRPPPPVALIKTIQQCVGELEQLPLDKDINLAVISPIARRLSRTQEILTASMMKPKQVNSLIVTKLENATTSTPTATRRGGNQKATAMQDAPPPTQSKRRGRPRKNQTTGLSESTAESSNDSFDVSEIAIISSPIAGLREESASPTSSTKAIDLGETASREGLDGDKDNEPFSREKSVSPASSTKAIDLREKTDPSAVTMSPSELMFVGAEEEVFTQDLSSDGSTSYFQSSAKEKSNDEVSLFGRSDSTETNSSDDSEHRRKKIRVSVKRVNLPSALREHVDSMLKGNKPTSEVIEVLSSNDDDSLQGPKEANKSSQDISETIQTRGSSKRVIHKSVIVVDGENSNSTTVGSIVEISSDSAATPVKELLATRIETESPQLRSATTRRTRNCRRQATENIVEEEAAQCVFTERTDVANHKDVQKEVCNQNTVLPDVLTKSTQQSKQSVQKQQGEVPSVQNPTQGPESDIQKETKTADGRESAEAADKDASTSSTVRPLSPRTRSQKEVHTETIAIVGSEDKQSDGPRKPPSTRSISLRKRKDADDQKATDAASSIKQADAEESIPACNAIASDKDEGPGASSAVVTIETPESGDKLTPTTADSSGTITAATSVMSPTQSAVCSDQKTSQSDEKLLTTAADEINDKVNVKLKPSDVEAGDKGLTESETSPQKPTNSSRRGPRESAQEVEEVPRRRSPPVIAKTKKASKSLARVISTDQSSSSSERSESPKVHNHKTPADADKSKEDTSSICSESSSVESSSTSSISSTTTTSASSSTSSTSSTSSSSLSDVHGRATRSRRSQQLVFDPDAGVQKSPKNIKAVGKEEQVLGPDSETSEHSLRRGKVRTESEISPKERTKQLHMRRSVRTNRFVEDKESNETSSESSDTSSSTRVTRTARSKVRSEVPSPVKPTSRSVECVRGSKAAVVDSLIKAEVTTESKDSSSSPPKQKSVENVAKDDVTVTEVQTSRPKKKAGRFMALKDHSLNSTTMRETRARRKTISSASELEELLDQRLSRDGEQKKQVNVDKTHPLEEMGRDSKEKLEVSQDKKKTTADGHKKVATEGDECDGKQPVIETNDKDAETPEDQCPKGTKQVASKTSGTDTEIDSRNYIKAASAFGSPKCKVAVKSIDKETLKLASGPRVNEARTLETNEGEAKVVVSACTKLDFKESKTLLTTNAACSEEKGQIDSDVPASKQTVESTKIVAAEEEEPISNDDSSVKIVNSEDKAPVSNDETSKPKTTSAKIVTAEEKGPINNDESASTPTRTSAKIVTAEEKAPISNDEPTSKPTRTSAKIVNVEEKRSIKNDQLTSTPTVASAKKSSPRVRKTRPTEVSTSAKREERLEQKAHKTVSVSKLDAKNKLDEEIAKESEEKVKKPASEQSADELLNKQSTSTISTDDSQIVPKIESAPILETGKQEVIDDCLKQNPLTISTENGASEQMHASKPPSSGLDPVAVSTLPAGDALISEPNLDNSSTKIADNVDDSNLMNCTLNGDTTSLEQTANETGSQTQTTQETADAQHITQPSPRKNKKSSQQEPQTSSTDVDQKKKKEPLDDVNVSNSDDSQKPDLTKADIKPVPCRQLDSSFMNSLEKSLVKPTSAKKPPKKKERPQPTPATPKDKDDTKKCKKNQSDDQKAIESTESPRTKKKQKDTAKKLDTETASAKRKSVSKNKNAEAPKPVEPSDAKIEVPENKTTDVPQPPVVIENTAPEVEVQQPKEVLESSPKAIKSKGETKFYPEEPPKEEKLDATAEACSPDGAPKEKSPDLVPDPLKDIEKFIEDGVNLLKRGYKLDEGEEGAGNNEAGKPDDSTTAKKCKLEEHDEDKKQTHPEDDSSNSNSEHSQLTCTPSSDVETPNGIRRSHRIKNNSKSAKCLVGRGLVRDRERFSMKDDEKTVYSIDDQKLDLAEVEAKNSKFLKDMEERLSNFRVIRENEYKCERVISKEAKRMLCDCFLTAEEEERGELGCGEDCLNRLLMIECGSDCTVKERCTNRRFTKFLYSPCRVFRTEKKGFGIMADIEILPGEFIMEYVGEVIDGDEFERRRNVYSQDKNKHYYFMALRSDAIIDATAKGNVSRFINHSCDPNAETQKWTVNGELRIGFFSRKSIMPGEEITFDYQYQRYGKEAQKCYCESSNCRGWIGEEPSSDEEEEEEEIDDEEEGETESEEEEEHEAVPLPAIPVISPPITSEGEQVVTEVPVLGNEKTETAELVPVLTPTTVEEATVPPKETQVKKKKEKRRQLDRKEDKIKRRETKQFLEDPDIEDEVRFLVKCGLRNQADTLRLSRLIVRAKLLGTRLNLLEILRAGELACRRLFLDYHGLRLLHGWMSEVIDTRDTEKSMEIRMALLSVLECLPISNKTMLTDSKVYQTVRDWSNNKESHSPSEESPKDSTTPSAPTSSPARTEDSSTELQKLAAKLVSTWDNLPEVFRIPKRERIEQMKEHEREADRQYKGLAEDVSGSEERHNRTRFIRNGPNSSRFKWSRSDKDKEREQRIAERRRYLLNNGPGKDGAEKTQNQADSHLSKEQRRELFAAKVARDEAEKRLAEERREFDIKCRFFGLDPKRLRPENMPFCVNPSTGQWYSTDRKEISTPPSYAHVQVPVKPKSTNPEDYEIPLMDLPPLWKFAITPKGKIYYYHVKIRIPQWEPPIKILPLAGQKNTHVKAYESDSSNAECADSSDDDIDIIKGLDPAKLQAYIEKKIEDRRLQRYTRLVEEKPISPRKEEDRIYNQMEVRKYKENKEKIRKRKEEIRRRRDTLAKLTTSIEANQPEPTPDSDEVAVDAIPIQDYLLSSDEEDKIKEECNNSPLIDKIVQGDKIVDELDALQCKRPLKRALPIREKYEHKKRKVDKNKESTKSTKRSKDGEGSSSSKYRKIREKFRCEIAGIIVHHLRPYRKETCLSGRILTDDDFNHLARKLTHFVMVKELKYCESIGQTLVVTESVKNKSREFIKKYMAKYGGVYVRPENDPEFKEIPFL